MQILEPQKCALLFGDANVNGALSFAVAGDFLPANIRLPHGETWHSMGAMLDETFDGAHGTFLNLECPVFVDGLRPTPQLGAGKKLSVPPDSITYLKRIRTIAVGIANNHIYDFGDRGVLRTREVVGEKDIAPIGAGNRLGDQPEVYIWSPRPEYRIGLWAAAVASRELATSRNAGVEPANVRRGRLALQRLLRDGAKTCIALLHAGAEGTHYPDPEDVRMMDSLAKLGFDLLVSCHSHRISGAKVIRRQNGKPAACFYGLGSIVSTEMRSPLEAEGIVCLVSVSQSGQILRVLARPVQLGNAGWGSTPNYKDSGRILTRFAQISTAICDGTYKGSYYKDRNRNLFAGQRRDLSVGFRSAGFTAILKKLCRVRLRHVKLVIHKIGSLS